MLSENQKELIKLKVNESTDIPILNEDSEGRVIDKVIDRLSPHLEPSLLAICPAPYVQCIKIALQEGVSSDEKRRMISEILKPVLAIPLAKQMAGIVDIALLPEYMEESILSVICVKIVNEFVEWTVGEVNERFAQRLEHTREVAPPLPEPEEPAEGYGGDE